MRLVRIRDWRLGALYYAFILGILGYVLGYSIVYEQRYRLKAVDLVGYSLNVHGLLLQPM